MGSGQRWLERNRDFCFGLMNLERQVGNPRESLCWTVAYGTLKAQEEAGLGGALSTMVA